MRGIWEHWENYYSISFQIEWDMIVVTVFLSILNQMEIHLVENRKENCHHDHIHEFYSDQETGVSRLHMAQLEPNKTPQTPQQYGTKGFKDDLHWVPIMLRGMSLSDVFFPCIFPGFRCIFSLSGCSLNTLEISTHKPKRNFPVPKPTCLSLSQAVLMNWHIYTGFLARMMSYIYIRQNTSEKV